MQVGSLEKFTGKLEKLRCMRTDESFVLSSNEQDAMGAAAVVAAAIGEAGQAATTAIAASDPSEPADWVEFELDGKKFCGWIWRCPFKQGDEVEVVAERHGDQYQVYAVARLHDQIIALYPHCSRGRIAHWKNAFKMWIKSGLYFGLGLSFVGGLIGLLSNDKSLAEYLRLEIHRLPDIVSIVYVIALPIIGILTWKWMRFVYLTEQIFIAFGWHDVKSIDLIARAKATPLDLKVSNIPEFQSSLSTTVTDAEYGYSFYRY